jgi:peptide chain release factor 1
MPKSTPSKNKKVLFRLTEKDFEFKYSMGTGAGGQKRNKTSSKVQCLHRPSGAVGVSDETRSQHQNKKLAFEKMAKSPEMKKWARLQAAKITGEETRINEKVEHELKHNTRIEIKDENGKWVEWDGKENDK